MYFKDIHFKQVLFHKHKKKTTKKKRWWTCFLIMWYLFVYAELVAKISDTTILLGPKVFLTEDSTVKLLTEGGSTVHQRSSLMTSQFLALTGTLLKSCTLFRAKKMYRFQYFAKPRLKLWLSTAFWKAFWRRRLLTALYLYN